MRVVIAWWLFIAALLALIISYIRKPRLPKLKPRLVYSGTTVPLKYNGKVGHRFLLPWSAETASFKTVPSVGAANMFAGCFTPMTIGVKAVRGRGRRFKLDDRTVQMLGRLEENPSGYPPKFSCIELSPEGKGKRKATSNTVFTATDSIRFYGKNPRANTKQKFIIKFS